MRILSVFLAVIAAGLLIVSITLILHGSAEARIAFPLFLLVAWAVVTLSFIRARRRFNPPRWRPVDRILPLGTVVRTTEDAGADDWNPLVLENRRWGAVGTVIYRSDAHGLCYHVRHADGGSEAWYEPAELEYSPR